MVDCGGDNCGGSGSRKYIVKGSLDEKLPIY